MLEHGVADVVQWTLATAAANKLNVVRSFAHGVDSTFPLQIKAGEQVPRLLRFTYASTSLDVFVTQLQHMLQCHDNHVSLLRPCNNTFMQAIAFNPCHCLSLPGLCTSMCMMCLPVSTKDSLITLDRCVL